MMKDTEMQLDTVEIVRWRLADGRTIADSDVHKLVKWRHDYVKRK